MPCVSFIRVIFEGIARRGVLYDMRDVVYRRLLTEDFAFYSKKKTGDLMSRQNRRHGSNPPLRCLHYLSGLRKYPAVLLCALHDLYGKCEAGRSAC